MSEDDYQTEADGLRLILQSSRAKILQQILAHPERSLSARELEYRNPGMKPSTIQYHLRELIDGGVVEKLKVPKGERKRDLPSTFYTVTEKGRKLMERANLLDEVDVWREVYERMERTREIEEIERMLRPGPNSVSVKTDERSDSSGGNERSDPDHDGKSEPESRRAIEKAVSRALDEVSERNFREMVDIAISLRDVDLDDPSNRIERRVVLPRGTGEDTTIVVFAEDETAQRAEEVADDVLSSDDLEELGDDDDVAKDLADATDFFVAEQSMMKDVGRHLGVVLGPRGKMPEPLDPDDDVVEVVNRMKNTVQLRSMDRRTFHTRVGAEGMSPEEIADNVDVVLRRLHSQLEGESGNVDSVYISTKTGSGVRMT
jgi:large subunit ribosomal protein L1